MVQAGLEVDKGREAQVNEGECRGRGPRLREGCDGVLKPLLAESPPQWKDGGGGGECRCGPGHIPAGQRRE